MADSFSTRARLDVNGKSYTYSSLAKLGERFDLAKLPYSMKILLENLLRHEDGGMTVGPEHIEAVATWDAKAEPATTARPTAAAKRLRITPPPLATEPAARTSRLRTDCIHRAPARGWDRHQASCAAQSPRHWRQPTAGSR